MDDKATNDLTEVIGNSLLLMTRVLDYRLRQIAEALGYGDMDDASDAMNKYFDEKDNINVS